MAAQNLILDQKSTQVREMRKKSSAKIDFEYKSKESEQLLFEHKALEKELAELTMNDKGLTKQI